MIKASNDKRHRGQGAQKTAAKESMNDIETLAENLIPLMIELRDTTENDRRIAEPIVEVLRNSDLCRMLLDTGASPRYTPEQWLRVLETLAGAEASVSWFVWNSGLACFWARFLDEPARARIFGDARRLFAGSTRPTGRAVAAQGGFRLSGRWALVSGCELAEYVYMTSVVHEDGVPRMIDPGHPDIRVLVVPKARCVILDTWQSGGLRGSGSHDVVVDDVFVPVADSFAPAPAVASSSPVAQLPIIAVMIAGIGAQFLGMARAAIAVAIEILRNKVSVDPGTSIQERPGVLADIASYSAAVTAAGSHLHATMEAIWETVKHQLPTAADRAALYSAGLNAATVARAAVVAMHAAAGTTAVYVDCPLERAIRDLKTMESHIAAQRIWLEDAGRVLLGHDATHPMFMI